MVYLIRTLCVLDFYRFLVGAGCELSIKPSKVSSSLFAIWELLVSRSERVLLGFLPVFSVSMITLIVAQERFGFDSSLCLTSH